MKRQHLLATALLVATPFAAMVVTDRTAGARPTQEHEEEESVLMTSMGDINAAMRTLRRALKDPEKRADCLALCHEMQVALIAGKAEVPPMAAKAEGDAKETLLTGYRRMMAETLMASAQLEVAILDGDSKKAGEIVRKLNEFKADGHEAYQEDE